MTEELKQELKTQLREEAVGLEKIAEGLNGGEVSPRYTLPTGPWNTVSAKTVGPYNSDREFGIQGYVEVDYTYYGSTNNVKSQVYYGLNGQIVGVLAFTYTGGGGANNDTVSMVQRIQ